jgi:hypothetical protein
MVTSGQIAVGTAAVAIDGVSTNPSRITISNVDNTDAVYIGGASVTTANGFGLQKLEMIQFDLAPLEQLYAVATKTGHTVSWLRQTI